jgi:hypothetical protein
VDVAKWSAFFTVAVFICICVLRRKYRLDMEILSSVNMLRE